MVTDPPAGIAFMSAEWDTHTLDGFEDFLTEVFLEAYRVLKPGAHILVWSIPRTSHRTACAIERAGFIIRDGLDNIKDRSAEVQTFLSLLSEEQIELLLRAGPADSFILHMFGSGFPKSLNVQKALIKLGSAVAAQWEGFGTALKPAIETWWLARKPLQEKTVVKQVLATGTGALNIDGCRVAGDMSELINPGTGKPRSGMGSHYNDEGGFGGDAANPPNALGRWPANVVLQHGPSCKKIGTKKVVPGNGSGRGSSGGDPDTMGYHKHFQHRSGGAFVDEDGTETIDNWECAPGCPVRALDEQSGEREVSGTAKLGKSHRGGRSGICFGDYNQSPTSLPNDTGGASRFFNNFEPDPEANPFFYTSKISSSERKEDLEEEGLVNKHPTVKSKKLMAHLVRLVTPPGGRVLDPFAGSGSTLVAAVEEGFSGVGVEKDNEFHTIATKRVLAVLERIQDRLDDEASFNLMFELESE